MLSGAQLGHSRSKAVYEIENLLIAQVHPFWHTDGVERLAMGEPPGLAVSA
jgi:hypothetical protein